MAMAGPAIVAAGWRRAGLRGPHREWALEQGAALLRARDRPAERPVRALTTIHHFACTMAKAASSPPSDLPSTYEDAVVELERLVAAMEAGQLPLDKLLESYRRGADLLNFCRARLEAVEQQVKVLENGQLKAFTSA
jgi:exodeoxyribonuclease VII small subunit